MPDTAPAATAPAAPAPEAPVTENEAVQTPETQPADTTTAVAEPTETPAPPTFNVDGEDLTADDLIAVYKHSEKVVQLKRALAEKEANINRVLQRMAVEPRAVLLHVFTNTIGQGDPDKGYEALRDFAIEIVNEVVADEEAPPEAREKKKLSAEIERLRAEQARLQKEAETRQRSAEEAQWEARYNQEIPAAMTKAGLDPKDNDAWTQVIDILVRADDVGRQVSVEQAAAVVVKRRAAKAQADRFKGARVEDLPAELVEAVRKAELAKVHSGNPTVVEGIQKPQPKRKPSLRPLI